MQRQFCILLEAYSKLKVYRFASAPFNLINKSCFVNNISFVWINFSTGALISTIPEGKCKKEIFMHCDPATAEGISEDLEDEKRNEKEN